MFILMTILLRLFVLSCCSTFVLLFSGSFTVSILLLSYWSVLLFVYSFVLLLIP